MPWCGAMPPKFAGRADAEWVAWRRLQTQQGRIEDLLRGPKKKARVDDAGEEEEKYVGKDWEGGFCICRGCGAEFQVGFRGERIAGSFRDRGEGRCYDCIDMIGSHKLPVTWAPTTRPDHVSINTNHIKGSRKREGKDKGNCKGRGKSKCNNTSWRQIITWNFRMRACLRSDAIKRQV